ncbi:lipase family protein [Alteromonadaceae bacterium M269]|nr:lipase family protein [Alteromonadaceae bacterium M269]
MSKVNFKQVQWYAERAAYAYDSPEEIRKTFPTTTRVVTVPGTNVQYFIEDLPDKKAQLVSIRGTANMKNALEDAEYLQAKDKKLDIYVHAGFGEDSERVYRDLLPHLDKDKEILLTGHSLGAAISTILMMYLQEEGFQVGQSINFGQPKVTNEAGAALFKSLPLLRVIDENDVVPLLPPMSLLNSIHGRYKHFGTEMILLEGEFYVFQDEHVQQETKSTSFWSNMTDISVGAHMIKHYLHNIKSKLNHSKQIPFEDRKQYIDS